MTAAGPRTADVSEQVRRRAAPWRRGAGRGAAWPAVSREVGSRYRLDRKLPPARSQDASVVSFRDPGSGTARRHPPRAPLTDEGARPAAQMKGRAEDRAACKAPQHSGQKEAPRRQTGSPWPGLQGPPRADVGKGSWVRLTELKSPAMPWTLARTLLGEPVRARNDKPQTL